MDSLTQDSRTISHKSLLVWGLAVAAATFIAYVPAIRSGWIWDDDHHVTENIELRTPHGLRQIWLRPGATPQYYPLTHTSFWIEYHLWQLHPLGYHLDNVLLHLANALLVGRILRRLNVPGYALAAAIFALHPVEVESVAWVTERKNLLSGFFYLLAIWMALDVWEIAPRKAQGTSSLGFLGRYALCLALFTLAILSKTVTASLPAAILLLIWWKRGRVTARQIAALGPMFILGAMMGSLTAWMEVHVVGATGRDWSWTFPQRILIASRAIWFYLAKLLWPHPLIFIYPRWIVSTHSPAQWLYPIGLLAILAALWLANRTALLVMLLFIVTLFPALGFVNTYPMRYSFVADHFQYLASIAPIAVAAAILRRWSIGVPLLLVLALLTWRQTLNYANVETLWQSVVADDPRSPIALGNLGVSLFNDGKLDEAEWDLRKALAADPHYVEARVNLAAVLAAKGDSAQAVRLFNQARVDAPDNPLPYWRLALWNRSHGDPQAAEEYFAQAAEYLPNPAPAFEEMGEMALIAGDFSKARTYLSEAISADPDRVDSHDNMASAFIGDPTHPDLPAAQEQCEASLAIDPGDSVAWNNLGVIFVREQKLDAAADCFRKALESNPGFDMARQNLARLGR